MNNGGSVTVVGCRVPIPRVFVRLAGESAGGGSGAKRTLENPITDRG
jgi:hypothetical protein